MKLSRSSFVLSSFCGISLGAFSALGQTGSAYQSTTTAAGQNINTVSGNSKAQVDNTKRNEKMTKNAELTAQDQGNSQKDLDLAAKVRRAIIDDKSLSLNAHNVKIIAANGQVVLKGPVKNDSERTRLSQIVNEIVGVNNVKNELEVSH
jgi:hyperosmotically inducible protein